MAKQVQLRRGTTAEHAAFTGVEGELTVDTTKDTLVLHDAYQAGGYPLLREDLTNLADSSVGVGKITNGSANQVLVTNSAGNASVWGSLTTDAMPSGTIIQHVYNRYAGRDAYSGSWHNTGVSATITPKYSNSKIIVQISLGRVGHYSNNTMAFRVLRNGASSNPLQGDSSGSRPQLAFTLMRITTDTNHTQGGVGFTGVDTPSTTSAVTYLLQAQCEGNGTWYLNRNGSGTDSGNEYNGSTASWIHLYEVIA